MTPDKSLRGFLITMLIGAGLMVVGQIGSWPPDGQLEVALTLFAGVAAVTARGLWAYESCQHRNRNQQP